MWGNIATESTFQVNFNVGFSNTKSDILIHLSQWQYWWWFWFVFLWSLYFMLIIRVVRFRTLKFQPRIVTSFRPHGKWGDLLVCLIPTMWCANILINSSFLLKLIEWQNETSLFTIRVRGKQWYWIYKFDVKDVADILSVGKNVGNNKFYYPTPNGLNNLDDYLHLIQLRAANVWLKNYWEVSLKMQAKEHNEYLVGSADQIPTVPQYLTKKSVISGYQKILKTRKFFENSTRFTPDYYAGLRKNVGFFGLQWNLFCPATSINQVTKKSVSHFDYVATFDIKKKMSFYDFVYKFKHYSYYAVFDKYTNSYIKKYAKLVNSRYFLGSYKDLMIAFSRHNELSLHYKDPFIRNNLRGLYQYTPFYSGNYCDRCYDDNINKRIPFNFGDKELFYYTTYMFGIKDNRINHSYRSHINYFYTSDSSIFYDISKKNKLFSGYFVPLKKNINFDEGLRWIKRGFGVNEPLKVIKVPYNKDSGYILKTRYSLNDTAMHKNVTYNPYLVVKQKRYALKKKILEKNFKVYDKTYDAENSRDIRSHFFLKNNVSSEVCDNLNKVYRFLKKNKKRDELFSVVTARRLLRTKRTLVLPAHVNITIITNSYDVVHSWFIPGLGLKLDCIPGRATHHTFYADNAGFYYGQCAEICGRYHHHMPIRVCILPYDQFLVWWHHFGLPRLMYSGKNKTYTNNLYFRKYVW